MSKNKNIGIWIVFSLCFLVLISGIVFYMNRDDEPEKTSYELTMLDLGFDTPVTFQAYGSEEEFVRYLDILRNRFTTNNALFDQYESYEESLSVHDINQQALNNWVEADPLILDCLQMAFKANALFEKFDVSQANLINLWHEFREGNAPLPSQDQILEAINPSGMEAIVIEDGKLMFADEKAAIDLGAIAKGYTVQQCVKELEEAGCSSGYINAGGNVALIGSKPDGEPWKIGIIEPDADRSLVRLTTNRPISLVTSGDYQRYVEVDGIRYSHIIDPVTGYPADYMRSVTVFNEDSAWADAMSTTLFLMSVQDGMEFCKQNNLEACWITQEPVENMAPDFVKGDFSVYCTEGIRDDLSLAED